VEAESEDEGAEVLGAMRENTMVVLNTVLLLVSSPLKHERPGGCMSDLGMREGDSELFGNHSPMKAQMSRVAREKLTGHGEEVTGTF
jgi:hypothetical protein